ncbi:NUDIX domain-containing protein [Cereibacter sphaeroides]|jgi:8-oxo-dGTP pyrophosphatase MutT (NUDIX family)|uniref:NUDIX domain-containing protein n=1 Tax=Cereibacter sphaeroides TaxID=1063 RepID=A0AAX1UM83_CERSP|nr:NUDIX hydrolase [Cereibacter sphaeroides]ABN76163.1 NUDIX hydrolase [Cereibacter sphaeroides ATCC 17029]AZB64249.1 NUDIX domain-containing protein [Cereibacter sphaeroides]AZB67823.1 NUDIX hydrolase [Cereibacter sphaeroides]RHZ96001.1 NUDIX domain-containing protein [Cereibacter sphaeroides]
MGEGRHIGLTSNGSGEVRPQCGAICWRLEGGELQVLLITSRDTGRWVIPKGGRIEGLDDADSAAQEAWEEAGIQGEIAPQPLGRFTYQKIARNAASIACEVVVFPLAVEDMSDVFPERGQRKRKWFTPDKAARKVAEPGLREILVRFDPAPEPDPEPDDGLPLGDY